MYTEVGNGKSESLPQRARGRKLGKKEKSTDEVDLEESEDKKVRFLRNGSFL